MNARDRENLRNLFQETRAKVPGLRKKAKQEEEEEELEEEIELDTDEESENGAAQQPRIFRLPNAPVYLSGLEYAMLDDDSWNTLSNYCLEHNLTQNHLEDLYLRFNSTLCSQVHPDFTPKLTFQVSLDFLQDEFLGTSGDLAAQVFMQTWYQRDYQGLRKPVDRRCIDFGRLVVMSCDLCALDPLELMSEYWSCLIGRTASESDPAEVLPWDLKLNRELWVEGISIIHLDISKHLNFIVHLPIQSPSSEASSEAKKAVSHLSMHDLMRYSYLNPQLVMPIYDFQRALRKRFCGPKHWRTKNACVNGSGVAAIHLPKCYSELWQYIRSQLPQSTSPETAWPDLTYPNNPTGHSWNECSIEQAWTLSIGSLLMHEACREDGVEASARQLEQLVNNLVKEAVSKQRLALTSSPHPRSISRSPGADGNASRREWGGAQTAPARVPYRERNVTSVVIRISSNPSPASTPDRPSRPCAYCLSKKTRYTFCKQCLHRARAAVIRAHGYRMTRSLLERYGRELGARDKPCVATEVVEGWRKGHDIRTGQDFYYNSYYGTALWKREVNVAKVDASETKQEVKRSVSSQLSARTVKLERLASRRLLADGERKLANPDLVVDAQRKLFPAGRLRWPEVAASS